MSGGHSGSGGVIDTAVVTEMTKQIFMQNRLSTFWEPRCDFGFRFHGDLDYSHVSLW